MYVWLHVQLAHNLEKLQCDFILVVLVRQFDSIHQSFMVPPLQNCVLCLHVGEAVIVQAALYNHCVFNYIHHPNGISIYYMTDGKVNS